MVLRLKKAGRECSIRGAPVHRTSELRALWLVGLEGSREPPIEPLEKAVLEAPEKLPLVGLVDAFKSNQCSSSVGWLSMWVLPGSGCHST